MNNTQSLRSRLIDEIVKRHPSIGVDKGWSYYVGGMADSGSWYFRKMFDVPIEELKAFLDDIILKESIQPTPLTKQELADSKIIHYYPTHKSWITELDKKTIENAIRNIDKKLLGL